MVLTLVNKDNFIQVHRRVSLMAYNTNPLEDCKLVGLEIDVGLRNEMRRFIQERIIHDLEATKRLLEFGEDYKDICGEIYTYAVEKYGKILFLSSLGPEAPNNNKVEVRYTHDKKAFFDHNHKFSLALNDKDLPESCKWLRQDFDPRDFKPDDYDIGLNPDFEARMSIFYG
jgi:hypothetical protein